jgi:hypothetical protein
MSLQVCGRCRLPGRALIAFLADSLHIVAEQKFSKAIRGE